MVDLLAFLESTCGALLNLGRANITHGCLRIVATLLIGWYRDLQALMLGHFLFILNWSDDGILLFLLLLLLGLIDFCQ